MAMNFLGLGFSFGAKDTGLGQMQDSVLGKFRSMEGAISGEFKEATTVMEHQQRRMAGGFDTVTDSQERAADKTSAWRSKLKDLAVAFNTFQLADVRDKLEDLAATNTQLTTSFEATAFQAAVSARQMAVNFGYSGAALRKFEKEATSLSVGLNVGAEEAALAVRGWTEAQDDLRAIGLRSASDLVKLTKVTGVNADVFRNSSMMMRREFGFTDEQIQQVFSSMTHMGQTTGDVASALNEMPQVMDRLRKKAALMGAELDPQELANFASAQSALASGFFSMGQDSDKARASAAQLTDTLLTTQSGMQDLLSGVADDMPQLAQELGILTGDVQKGFALMEQGPAGFIQGLTAMVAASKEQGRFTDQAASFLASRLRSTLGEEAAAQMMGFFRSANKETFSMIEATQAATVDMRKLAKEGFSTGRTLSDRIDFAKDKMVASFRTIGRTASRTFVENAERQFKVFGRGLQNLAKDKGPLGAFVTKLSEAHQLGLLAFLPETLRPFGAVLGDVSKEIIPVVTMLGILGPKVLFLLGPIGLLVGGIGALVGWFVSLRGAVDKAGRPIHTTASALEHMKDQALGFVGRLPEKIGALLRKASVIGVRIADFLANVDWRKVGQTISDALVGIFNPKSETGKQVHKAAKDLWTAVGRASTSIAVGVRQGWGQIDWGELLGEDKVRNYQQLWIDIGEDIETIQNAVLAVGEAVGTVAFGIYKVFESMWVQIETLVDEVAEGNILGAPFVAMWEGARTLFPEVIGEIEFLFSRAWEKAKKFAKDSFESFWKMQQAIGNAFLHPIENLKEVGRVVDEIFGNSVHDYVEKDMGLASKIFGRETDAMVSDMARLQAGVNGGVVREGAQSATPLATQGRSIGKSDVIALIDAIHSPRWYHDDLKGRIGELVRIARQGAAGQGETPAQALRRRAGAAVAAAKSLPDELGLSQRLATNAAGIPR